MPDILMKISGICFAITIILSLYRIIREVRKTSNKNRIIKYTFKDK